PTFRAWRERRELTLRASRRRQSTLCLLGASGLGLGRLAATLSETHALRQRRAGRRIVRRHHGIVLREPPLRPVFFWAQVVFGPKVTLQRFEPTAIFETDQGIRAERLPHAHGRGLRDN